MFTVRALWEGKWAVLALSVLGLAGLWWCWQAAAIPFALLGFVISFFRDPDRTAPADPNLIVAPADGRIVEINNVHEPHFLKGDAQMVAIFLSVFDVHVQRAPIEGEVKLVQHNKGKFLDARHPQAGALNENRVIGIEAADGFRVTVRQIAGLIARRIVGWTGPGERLAKGQRIGMIRFGSRVELFLPSDAEIIVKCGDYAKGGETVLARRR